MRLLYLLSIWSTIFLLQEQFKSESINFSVHSRYVKILHTYSLISHAPFQNISNTTVWPPTKLQTFSTPFQRDPHHSVWPLTCSSNSQNAGLAANQYLKFSTPLEEKTFTKPDMASTSAQNIDPILGRLHRTLPISTTFPNIEPVHSPNYGSKGIWAFSRQNIADAGTFRSLELKDTQKKYPLINYYAF